MRCEEDVRQVFWDGEDDEELFQPEVGRADVLKEDKEEGSDDEGEGEEEVGVEQLVDPAIWATYQRVATAMLANHSSKCGQDERDVYTREALAMVFSLGICRGMEPDKAGEWLELMMRLVHSDLKPEEVKNGNGKRALGFRVNGNGG
jgi:hypothetical protein